MLNIFVTWNNFRFVFVCLIMQCYGILAAVNMTDPYFCLNRFLSSFLSRNLPSALYLYTFMFSFKAIWMQYKLTAFQKEINLSALIKTIWKQATYCFALGHTMQAFSLFYSAFCLFSRSFAPHIIRFACLTQNAGPLSNWLIKKKPCK